MRPISFFIPILLLRAGCLTAQSPVNLALRLPGFEAAPPSPDGIGWMLFSRQYYCVSNWNAAGLAVTRASGGGESAALLYRDGIPGYVGYHLNLSHYQHVGAVSGMMQLRFSVISLTSRRPVFRLGGNLHAVFPLGPALNLETTLYDFPGWLFPGTAVARGDPAMRFQVFHEPGRLISLTGGFGVSRMHFGPVTAGVRMKVHDQVVVCGYFDVLPFGVSVGVQWRMKWVEVRLRVEQKAGAGVTPMVEVWKR
jgi:hypothetical protein